MRFVLLPLGLLACAEGEESAVSEAVVPEIVLTVHVEGLHANHERHVQAVQELLDVAEAHGRRLTLEAAPEFLDAEVLAGGTFLADAQAAGHDVTVHLDVYAYEDSYGDALTHVQQVVAEAEQLGITKPQHTSGVCSRLDWVSLAEEAGFGATSGIVAYCLRSLQEVPDDYAEFADCATPSDCHEHVPTGLSQRLYPWRAHSGKDWLADAGAGTWIVPSAVNFPCALENEMDPSAETCPITGPDIPALLRVLDEAIADTAFSRQKVVDITWSLGSEANADQLETLFDSLGKRVDAGKARWVTMREALAGLEGG